MLYKKSNTSIILNIFKKYPLAFFHFLSEKKIWIALAAVCLSLEAQIIAIGKIRWEIDILALFLCTHGLYWIHQSTFKPGKFTWRALFKLRYLPLFLGIVLFCVSLNIELLRIIWPIIIIFIYYFILKKLPNHIAYCLKPFVLAAAWIYIPQFWLLQRWSLLPEMYSPIWISNFLWMSGLCILFEYKDYHFDGKTNPYNLYALFNPKVITGLLAFLYLASFLLVIFFQPFSWPFIISISLFYFLLFGFQSFRTNDFDYDFFYVLGDGFIFIHAFIFILFFNS